MKSLISNGLVREKITFLMGCLFVFLLLKMNTTCAQTIHNKPINFLNVEFTRADLPDDILKKRSIGIVFSDIHYQGKKEVWQEIATLSHPTLAQLGVDIVAWYNAKEVEISDNRRSILYDIMTKRQIDYLVFFFFEKQVLTMHITAFNKKKSLILSGQASWSIAHEKIDVLLSNLKRAIVSKNLVKENLMILDKPEFHSLIYGKGIEILPENIRLIYEPNLKSTDLIVNIPPRVPNKELLYDEVQIDSVEMLKIMQNYRCEYTVRSPHISDVNLLKEKKLYRLFWVYGTPEKIIKTYHIDTSKWDAVPGMKSKIPLEDRSYFKPMVKNIYSRTIMCGDRWDGGKTISEAMENFINNKACKN